MNFSDYRLELKISKSKEWLENSSATVDRISLKMGYENTDSFIRIFKRFCRCTPSRYRYRVKKKKAGQRGDVSLVDSLVYNEKVKLIKEKETAEKLVEEKTKELKKTKRILKKEKSLSEIGKLASIVAHELRNPLNVIQAAIWNIKKKNRNPDLEENIKNIEKKLVDSEAIIDNLLKYARIRMPVLERVNVADILNDCVDTAEKRFRKRKGIVKRRYAPLSRVFLDVDPLQMRQVFTNLLSNAYQSLKGRRGQILITGRVCSDQSLEVVIQDNGPGISSSVLPKIFEPFFTGRPGGTGLGLAVCKQLISLHKGSIHVESRLGQGTTVTVKLPLFSSPAV